MELRLCGIKMNWIAATQEWSATVALKGGLLAQAQRVESVVGAHRGKDIDAVVEATVKRVAEHGVKLGSESEVPSIWLDSEEEGSGNPLTDGWQQLLDAQSLRLGWEPFYEQEGSSAAIPLSERPTA